jgi:hypothetical protein
MARSNDRKKFIELAEKRVRRALKDIKLIGNLSNRSNYVYTEKDVKKIHRTLQSALSEMKMRFERNGDDAEADFKLDE